MTEMDNIVANPLTGHIQHARPEIKLLVSRLIKSVLFALNGRASAQEHKIRDSDCLILRYRCFNGKAYTQFCLGLTVPSWMT